LSERKKGVLGEGETQRAARWASGNGKSKTKFPAAKAIFGQNLKKEKKVSGETNEWGYLNLSKNPPNKEGKVLVARIGVWAPGHRKRKGGQRKRSLNV